MNEIDFLIRILAMAFLWPLILFIIFYAIPYEVAAGWRRNHKRNV